MTFEVVLVRLFSSLMSYHLAFFVLVIALFGVGLGGLWAQIARERRAAAGKPPMGTQYFPILLSLSVIGALFVLLSVPLGPRSMSMQVSYLLWLVPVFLGAAAPFFLGSVFISNILAARPSRANLLYFSDLVGASAGCVLAVPLLEWLGGTVAPFAVAAMSALSVLFAAGPGRGRRAVAVVAALAVVAGALGGAQATGLLDVRPSWLNTKLLFSKWNFFSRITI